jgi:hypothetical protein
VFTARYALSPYKKQIRYVFKGLIQFTPTSYAFEVHCNILPLSCSLPCGLLLSGISTTICFASQETVFEETKTQNMVQLLRFQRRGTTQANGYSLTPPRGGASLRGIGAAASGPPEVASWRESGTDLRSAGHLLGTIACSIPLLRFIRLARQHKGTCFPGALILSSAVCLLFCITPPLLRKSPRCDWGTLIFLLNSHLLGDGKLGFYTPERNTGWVSDDRALRKAFGLNRDEVTVDWRRMHNEELHNLYS